MSSDDIDIVDHLCDAWEANDSIIPNTIQSAPYDRFFINIDAEFVYQQEDEYDDEDEQQDILDCLKTITRQKKFEIRRDRLTNPTTSWSTISDMLTAMGVRLHIQPFMIHKISDCVKELTEGSSGRRSVIPMMVSVSVVIEEDEAEAIMEMDGDDGGAKTTMAASEGAVEILKKLRMEEEGGCMVCLEEIGVGCEATEMPCCHVYHTHCILNWLRVANFCPLCRHQLPNKFV